MSTKRPPDSSGNANSILPAYNQSTSSAVGEVQKIRRRGGYFVAVAGWSGLLYWLTAKLFGFVTSGVVWVIVLSLIWAVADETARSAVRKFLGDSRTTLLLNEDRRQFPVLETEAYHEFPAIWRQLLAEVQFNQAKYPARLVSTVRELSPNDIGVMDRIAPYILGNAIIHADDFEMGYDIPFVDDVDLERLKTIGITTDGKLGLYREIRGVDGEPGHLRFAGTTLLLLIRALKPDTEEKIHVTSLTDEGETIFQLLNRPTSLQGVCNIAWRLKEKKNIVAEIYARFESESEDNAWSNPNSIAKVSVLCSRYGIQF